MTPQWAAGDPGGRRRRAMELRGRYNDVVMGSAYRRRQEALKERRHALEARLTEIDAELEGVPSSWRFPKGLRQRLGELRSAAVPDDESVEALVVAERAAETFEETLDEALGLGAELRKSVDPLLPRKETVVRWMGFASLSLTLLLVGVHQLGLADFMLRAVGVKVQRAGIEMSTSGAVHRTAIRLGALPRREAPAAQSRAMPTVVPDRVELITTKWSKPTKKATDHGRKVARGARP